MRVQTVECCSVLSIGHIQPICGVEVPLLEVIDNELITSGVTNGLGVATAYSDNEDTDRQYSDSAGYK